MTRLPFEAHAIEGSIMPSHREVPEEIASSVSCTRNRKSPLFLKDHSVTVNDYKKQCPDPPIFIVGAPRSGTTLLRDLLRSHPRLTFPRESHFIPRFYRAYGDPRNEREACRLAEAILSLHWVKKWELSVTADSFADCRTLRDVLTKLYGSWASKENKPRWGDKTPQYVTKLPTISHLFPDGKIIHIIHIIRDGRDVAMSWTRRTLGSANLYDAAMVWKRAVTLGREAGAKLPEDNYLEVHYESLLAEPETTMEIVCGFLDEPFTHDVLSPNRISRKPVAMLSGGSPPGPVSNTEIVSTNSEKWKSLMSRSDRILFESIAGEQLDTLGYETEGVARPISSWEAISWTLHNWVGSKLKRMNVRNKRTRIPTELRMRWIEWRGRYRHRRLPHSIR